MSFKPTIVVVVLALLGVAVVVAVRRPDAVATESTVAALPGASDLPADDLTRITVERAGAPALEFARGDQGWAQVRPFAHPVDPFSIRQLAIGVAQLEVVKRLGADALDGIDLGLDPPRSAVTYAWPGGTWTLHFGRRAVAGRWYLRVAGDPAVYVVRGDLYERAVTMDSKEWRDRTIFPGVSPDADRITIADGGNRTVLQRDRRRWQMIEPVRTRVDAAALDELLSALGRAASGGFIADQPEDLARFGLDRPVGTVTVTLPRGAGELQLAVGSRMGVGSEDRFGIVSGPPVVVRVPEAVLAAFFRPARTFIDPTASGVTAANVKSLIVRGPGDELRLERDLERWRAAEQGVEVPPELVEGLLQQLTARRASRLELRPYPRDLQVATVTMYGFDGMPLDTVRIAREPDGGPWLLDDGDDVLRVFPAETTIPLTPAEFGLTAQSTR
jgi:hypothetical protein